MTSTLAAPAAPAIVGYDAVANAIWSKAEYGPCVSCHTLEWPLLADFDALSASAVERGYADVAALGAAVVDCVDMNSEVNCAGEPTDPMDNIDYKMPSKFGFSSLAEDDVALLRRWLADGAKDQSLAAGDAAWSGVAQVTSSQQGERYELQAPTLIGIAGGTLLTIRQVFRRSADAQACLASTLQFDFLDAQGALIVSADGAITCIDGKPKLTLTQHLAS